jgi:hypothetical protein
MRFAMQSEHPRHGQANKKNMHLFIPPCPCSPLANQCTVALHCCHRDLS